MKVSLHSADEQDIQEAAAFYEREGSPIVAARFVAEFKRLASLLLKHPEIGSPTLKWASRFVDERLPLPRHLSRERRRNHNSRRQA
jgi:plasmid stabilization system protein ParE